MQPRMNSRDATGQGSPLYSGEPKWSKLKPAEKFAAMYEQHGYGTRDDIADEWRFHPTKQWRLDFAWPALLVGVEIHGFGFGHQAQQCIAEDCEKMRAAIELGWLVLPFTTRCISSRQKCYDAVDYVCRILEMRAA